MPNLSLIELVDESFHSNPFFLNLKNFYKRQESSKVNIFGFTKSFLKSYEDIFYLVSSPDMMGLIKSIEPSLINYGVEIQKEVFNNLNNHFRIFIRDYVDLENQLEIIKNKRRNYIPKDLCFGDLHRIQEEENLLMRYQINYLSILKNIRFSKIKSHYSGEIKELVAGAKKSNNSSFSLGKLNDYLLGIYKRMILLEEDINYSLN